MKSKANDSAYGSVPKGNLNFQKPMYHLGFFMVMDSVQKRELLGTIIILFGALLRRKDVFHNKGV